MHNQCVCHITNLIVGDGLKELSPSIASIRNAVRYIRSSPARLKRFKEVVEEEQIESKALLCMDVPTRWNSTYLMLEAALKFKKAFEKLEDDLYYRSHFLDARIDGPPNDSDWMNASIFVRFLKTFYDLTLKVSGTLYATSNYVLQEICELKQELDILVDDGESLMCKMATNFMEKFDKYWGHPDKINPILFLVTVLDPRYKLDYLSYCARILFRSDVAVKLVDDIKNILMKLFNEYNDIAPPSLSTSTPEASTTSTKSPNHSASTNHTLGGYVKARTAQDGGLQKNDVERYLTEECEDVLLENFDVLGWWKINSGKFRILSRIAKDVLAVPMSTVASESAFSTSGRILDPFRSSLKAKTLERLICTKNWLSDSDDMSVCREFMDEIDTLKDSIDVENGNTKILSINYMFYSTVFTIYSLILT